MKKIMTVLCVVILLLVCGSVTFGRTYDHDDDRLFLEIDYNMPYNNIAVEDSFSYGLGFRFWGIFFFSGMVSNNPDFLSGGAGMKIPLGGFGLVWEWGKGYTADRAIMDYCNSTKIGLELDIDESVGLQVFKKYWWNFAPQSGMGNQAIDMVGAGLVVNF